MTEAVDRLNIRVSLREKMAMPQNTFLHLSALARSVEPPSSDPSSDDAVSKENAGKDYHGRDYRVEDA